MDRRLVLLSAVCVATRLWALSATDGMFHFDGLYQVLEPAHRIVFGYGITSWEFSAGMRSMVYPYVVAFLFWFFSLLGVKDILSLVFVARVPSVLCSVGVVCLTYLLGSRLYSRDAGFYAGFFAVFSGLLLGLSAQVMAEVPAMFFSLACVYLFYVALVSGSKTRAFFSGALLGVSFMFRFAEAVYFVPLVLTALLRGRMGVLKGFFAGFLLLVFVQGVVDYFSWGVFLHSPAEFVRQNLLEGKAGLFGAQPVLYYAAVFLMHLPLLSVMSFSVESRFETKYLWFLLLSYLFVFSILPHKEVRFMATVLPLFFVLAARGLEKAVIVWGVRTKPALLSLVIALFLVFALGFPWGQDSAYYGALNYVGGMDDSSGVAYDMKWFESGAYTFLHKGIPAVHVSDYTVTPMLEGVSCGLPERGFVGFQCAALSGVLDSGWVNYLVVSKNESALAPVLASRNFSLVRSFSGVSVYRRA